jgi:hypothetical protein
VSRIKIEVAELELEENGNTLWVHGPNGATVLRIKTLGKIITSTCGVDAITSHCDIVVQDDIEICLLERVKEDR